MSRSAAVSLTPPPSRLADLTTIAAAFMQAFAPGLPRYLQLQHAIIGLIRSGELRSGAQLPPDQQLTGALDVSLGTVQKAFAGLASEGWISREHGRGTFIAQPRQPVTELWHYRFRDSRSEAMLPVYSRLLKRRHVAADERVRGALGEDPKGFIEIERLVDIGGKFTCYSELYLPAGRFCAHSRDPDHQYRKRQPEKAVRRRVRRADHQRRAIHSCLSAGARRRPIDRDAEARLRHGAGSHRLHLWTRRDLVPAHPHSAKRLSARRVADAERAKDLASIRAADGTSSRAVAANRRQAGKRNGEAFVSGAVSNSWYRRPKWG